jgi:hypothetical protein
MEVNQTTKPCKVELRAIIFITMCIFIVGYICNIKKIFTRVNSHVCLVVHICDLNNNNQLGGTSIEQTFKASTVSSSFMLSLLLILFS